MKKYIILILSLFLIGSLSSCDMLGQKENQLEIKSNDIKEIKEKTTNTKKELCEKNDSCCNSSLDIINKNYYKVIDNKDECPEGFKKNLLRCITSLTWCEEIIVDEENADDVMQGSASTGNIEPITIDTPIKSNTTKDNSTNNTIFELTHDGKFLQDICIENHGDTENTKKLIEKMKDDILDDEMSLMPYEATKIETKFVDNCSEKYDYYCEIKEKSVSFKLESDSSGINDANIEVNDSGFTYKAHFAPVGYGTKEGKGIIMLSCAAGGGKLYGPNGEIKTENDWK